ncbi:MAG: hypothetical protein EZS28_012029 [Streblomastix strix]|uniref:Uncharacterized protein n=1 Tax=Streblomastix strix TaxID=222440 RepID=A0A5J4WCR3_9EUKA|nr:MAG: hypothetical protein EZS28_012029 [Streblomastix strix]
MNLLQPLFEGTKRAMVVMQESLQLWKIAVIYSYPGLISLFGMWIRVCAFLSETTVLKLIENQRMKALKNMWKVGMKFISGRMIAPSSKIEPGQDLKLSCLGEYAVSVAHRGYFESKQITLKHGYDEITDEDDEAKMSFDSFID